MNACLKFFIGLFIGLVLTSGGCKNESTYDPDPLLLLKCWSNAFEEEGQDGIRIFRPCATHTFATARYRHTFTLKENGTAEYSVLAPNDAHTTEKGKWEYDVIAKKLNILDMDGSAVDVYEVLEIGEDVLKVRE